MADETEASPELTALRRELGILISVFTIVAEGTIRAKQWEEAKATLEVLDRLVVKAQDAVNSQLATEELGRPVKMTGSVLSVAKDEAQH